MMPWRSNRPAHLPLCLSECVPAELGNAISKALSIPTIGIGAGSGCDGQVLVITDLLGVSGRPVPKFVKKFANLNPVITEALVRYKAEVEEGTFPTDEQSY